MKTPVPLAGSRTAAGISGGASTPTQTAPIIIQSFFRAHLIRSLLLRLSLG